ncbi:hypothetical protein CBR_g32329 [Chara braunii]|uniref:Reverse transcriptase RNase H-like domain-containing protein n=1 Tax=Chara braunii TaxID=69332 RepID=A0A388JNF8_CHABU|nr:hypothetical protein CBR_g32329 [Chara braunii]|eukprot:GBG59317.1 hypothetical protein CBR_g32329 [Chara braunii]
MTDANGTPPRVMVSIPATFPFYPNYTHPKACKLRDMASRTFPVIALLLRNTAHDWFIRHRWVDWDTFKRAFLARFDAVSENAAWFVLKTRPQELGELLPDFVDRFQTALDKSGREENVARDLFIDHLRNPVLKAKLQKKVPPKTNQLSVIITKALGLDLLDTLPAYKCNYSAPTGECYAALWGISHFRAYLYGRKFTLMTDHELLLALKKSKDYLGMIERWATKLQSMDFDIRHRKHERHDNTDGLTRLHHPDKLGVEAMSAQAVKDVAKVSEMLLRGTTVDQDIVEVNENVLLQDVLEDVVHHRLEGSGSERDKPRRRCQEPTTEEVAGVHCTVARRRHGDARRRGGLSTTMVGKLNVVAVKGGCVRALRGGMTVLAATQTPTSAQNGRALLSGKDITRRDKALRDIRGRCAIVTTTTTCLREGGEGELETLDYREGRILQVAVDGLIEVEVVTMVTLRRQQGNNVLLTIVERVEATREVATLLRRTVGRTVKRGTTLGSVVREGGIVPVMLRLGRGSGVKTGPHLLMGLGGLISLRGRYIKNLLANEVRLEYHTFRKKALDLEATLGGAQPLPTDGRKKKSPQEWKKKGSRLMMVDGTQTEIEDFLDLVDGLELDGEDDAEGSNLDALVKGPMAGRDSVRERREVMSEMEKMEREVERVHKYFVERGDSITDTMRCGRTVSETEMSLENIQARRWASSVLKRLRASRDSLRHCCDELVIHNLQIRRDNEQWRRMWDESRAEVRDTTRALLQQFETGTKLCRGARRPKKMGKWHVSRLKPLGGSTTTLCVEWWWGLMVTTMCVMNLKLFASVETEKVRPAHRRHRVDMGPRVAIARISCLGIT